MLLTGEIGAGKTTVWRRFLEDLPSNVDVASVVNPKLDAQALIARICEDLHLESAPDEAPIDLIDALHSHLLLAHAMGRRTLIVIDEAQALSSEVLEQLRLLTNLDSSGRKLQVMLIGQPELRQMLEMPQLEPLAQRVVARYHLPALSESETAGYIAHRLAVAGLRGPSPFDGESIGLDPPPVPRRAAAHQRRLRSGDSPPPRPRVDAASTVTPSSKPSPGSTAPRPSAGKPATERKTIHAGVTIGVAAAALAVGVLMAPRVETWWSSIAADRKPATTLTTASLAPQPSPAASDQAQLAPPHSRRTRTGARRRTGEVRAGHPGVAAGAASGRRRHRRQLASAGME